MPRVFREREREKRVGRKKSTCHMRHVASFRFVHKLISLETVVMNFFLSLFKEWRILLNSYVSDGTLRHWQWRDKICPYNLQSELACDFNRHGRLPHLKAFQLKLISVILTATAISNLISTSDSKSCRFYILP